MTDLSFSFDGKEKVIDDLNLTFSVGKSYAIVGPSGVGKSTLIDLLLKFYDPSQGHIYYDSIPLSEVGELSLRNRIVLLGQQNAILNDTIKNNIQFGQTIPMERLQKACRLALIDETIQSLPKAMDTVLNYQGTNLSGGQRQRICLARALAREAEILVLDEATTGLDAQTRDQIVKNILNEYKEKMVLFVTHDSFICQNVSEVIQLKSKDSP